MFQPLNVLDDVGECYSAQNVLEEGIDVDVDVDVTLIEDRVGELNNLLGHRLLPTGQAPVLILDGLTWIVKTIKILSRTLRFKLESQSRGFSF